MSLVGNTVRLSVTFRDFDDELASPEDVVFRVYDSEYNQVGEDVSVTETSVGLFEYDYTIPVSSNWRDNTKPMYYEFYGTLEGNVAIGRGEITRSFT